MNTNQWFKITYRHRAAIWNTAHSFMLGKDYLLEMKNNQIWVSEIKRKKGITSPSTLISLTDQNQLIEQILGNGKKLLASPFQYPDSVSYRDALSIAIPAIPKLKHPAQEDAAFMKATSRVLGIAILLISFAGILSWKEEAPETKEDLIPKKFAKIILSKPVTPKKSDATAKASQAPVKTIARAFQSRTVVKGMQKIFNGGLSKYSVFSSGKSISKLMDTMNSKTAMQGTSSDSKTNGLLGAMRTGNYQVGSSLGVVGQGSGRLEIGLNLTDASVDEGLTKEEVAKVIHSHLNEIRYCYESAIANDPSLAGKILVGFKISSLGRVTSADAEENTMQSRIVSGCLVTKLKNWKFPEPRGGVHVAVTYPFIFKSMNR